MKNELPKYYQEAVEIRANYQYKLAEGRPISRADEVAFSVALWILAGFEKKERDEKRNQSVYAQSSN